MSFEAESNSELTVIVPAYQLHFRFPVQNKIHKPKILSDTWTGILCSIACPCDFLPARSDEFQKVWVLQLDQNKLIWYYIFWSILESYGTVVIKFKKWLSKLVDITRYKMQDILLTNHSAHKELNNHNIYNIHNWIDLNTHNMKTIDRINIHKKC
jgi:hypothetical protein